MRYPSKYVLITDLDDENFDAKSAVTPPVPISEKAINDLGNAVTMHTLPPPSAKVPERAWQNCISNPLCLSNPVKEENGSTGETNSFWNFIDPIHKASCVCAKWVENYFSFILFFVSVSCVVLLFCFYFLSACNEYNSLDRPSISVIWIRVTQSSIAEIELCGICLKKSVFVFFSGLLWLNLEFVSVGIPGCTHNSLGNSFSMSAYADITKIHIIGLHHVGWVRKLDRKRSFSSKTKQFVLATVIMQSVDVYM